LPFGNTETKKVNGKVENLNKSMATESKWAVDSSSVIHERANNDKKKMANMYKMYMGLNDTPFQRHFKELYGNHQAPNTITNVKKQRDNLGQTIGFNQHATNRPTYSDLDAKGRRAKELDSSLWNDNQGNYKEFKGNDMVENEKTKMSTTTNWNSKEAARNIDNRDRKIDTKAAKQDHLASEILQMTHYEAPAKNQIPSWNDDEHELKYKEELKNRTAKKRNTQKMLSTNTPWNDARSEGLSNFIGQERKSNLLNLFNQSQNLKDPKAQHSIKSFDISQGFPNYTSMPNQIIDPYEYYAKKNNLDV
jgi:hypothetical protein